MRLAKAIESTANWHKACVKGETPSHIASGNYGKKNVAHRVSTAIWCMGYMAKADSDVALRTSYSYLSEHPLSPYAVY